MSTNQPAEHAVRKGRPVCTGVLDYFPDAIIAVSETSKAGNDQHNPGQPLHWDKSKSTDHADCIVRHLIERGTIDTDGIRHSAKVAWRALALLQTELDAERASTLEKCAPIKAQFGWQIRVSLPVRDTAGSVYAFSDTSVGVAVREREHGMAILRDLAENGYLGREMSLVDDEGVPVARTRMHIDGSGDLVDTYGTFGPYPGGGPKAEAARQASIAAEEARLPLIAVDPAEPGGDWSTTETVDRATFEAAQRAIENAPTMPLARRGILRGKRTEDGELGPDPWGEGRH